MLGLLPDVFWRLTPHELTLLVEGYNERERRTWEKICVVAAPSYSRDGKTTLTPDELMRMLGIDAPTRSRKSAEELVREGEEILREHAAKGII